MAEAGESSASNFNTPEEMDFSSSKFSIDAVRKELTDRGVAVIANVIPESDCATYQGQINAWLDLFGESFPSNVNSIIHKYNVAHLEPCWRVRLKAKAVFAQLWGTEKLLTSTDGLAIGKPPEMGGGNFGYRDPRDGLHFDQGMHRHGLHAYQGAMYLEEATAEDWCFAVMERSNKYHEAFFKQFKGSSKSEFRKLNDVEFDYLKAKGCDNVRVAVPKGGLVLWDSRTVHAGAPPVFGRKNMERWRYVVFVSQTPAIWATNQDLEVKKDAYYNLKCSRHWSSNGVSNFLTRPSKKYDIVELPEVASTSEVQRLAGVEPYDFGDGKPNGPRYSKEQGATVA